VKLALWRLETVLMLLVPLAFSTLPWIIVKAIRRVEENVIRSCPDAAPAKGLRRMGKVA
jgi:hypothetical protein